MPAPRPSRIPRGVVLSRRSLLGRMGVLAGAGLVGPTVLAACGGDDGGSGGGGGDSNALWHENWTGYMDEETRRPVPGGVRDRPRVHRALRQLRVVRQVPGRPGGEAATSAPTSSRRRAGWPLGSSASAGWQELPLDDIPNISNLVPDLQNPDFDPDGKYSLPYQSGMTGIAYNIAETGRELTSMADLFDPEFKGRVGMLTEMRDTVGAHHAARPARTRRKADHGRCRRGLRHDRRGQLERPDPRLHRQRLHGRPGDGELRRLHRVVGRHLAARARQPRSALRHPRGGRHALVRHDGHPGRAPRTSPTRPCG